MKNKISIILAFAILLLSSFPSYAAKPTNIPRSTSSGERQNVEKTRVGSTKPSTSNARSCEAQIANIKNRSTSLTNFVANVIETFDKISTRVQKYYTDKVAPTAQVVNYSELVSDISTKKLASQAALTKAQSIAATFSCTTGDSKTLISNFNEQIKLTKSSLSEYRTSIKNLIAAVHPILKDKEKNKPEIKTTITPKNNGGQQ